MTMFVSLGTQSEETEDGGYKKLPKQAGHMHPPPYTWKKEKENA